MTKVDPEIEEMAIRRVKRFKAEHDADQVWKALSNLKKMADVNKKWPEGGGGLLPIFVGAAKAGSTLGEMTKVQQGVFGYNKRYY